MSITIGRVTIVEALAFVEQDGDRLDFDVTVTNRTTGGSVTAGKMLRHQLLGMVDNDDEEIIPLVSTDDPELDGYYRVLGVTVTPLEVFLASGAMTVSVSLERVADGWNRPVLELVSTGAVRTNAVGVIDGEPDGVIGWRYASAPSHDFPATVTIYRENDPDDLRVFTEVAPWSATSQKVFTEPSLFYSAGARIEFQADDDVWYPVVGRQAPAGMAGRWRIGNGQIRVSASATTIGDLKVELWVGDEWVSMSTELVYGQHNSGTGLFTESPLWGGFGTGYAVDVGSAEWIDPFIVRNDRDTCIIGFRRANQQVQTFTVNIGDYFVEFWSHRLSSGGAGRHAINARSSWTAAALSATAPFSAAAGIQSSANDANGNRLLLLYTDAAFTRYTTSANGLYQTLASDDAAFGIAAILQGSGAVTGNAALDLAEQWMVAKSWRTFVVTQ